MKISSNLTLCSRVVCTVVKKAALSEIKRLSLNEGKQYIFNSVCKEFKPSVQRLSTYWTSNDVTTLWEEIRGLLNYL